MRHLTICAALLLVPVGAAAQQAAPPVSAPANLPAATAELFAPSALMLEQTGANFDQSFKATLAKNAQMAAMEQKHPGLLDALSSTARDIVLTGMEEGLPDLHRQIADLIANDFDGVEQRQLYDFMASPTDRRMVAMGAQVYNRDKLRAGAIDGDGKPALTADTLAGAVDPNFMDRVSAADMAVLAAFSATPGGQKMVADQPKLQALTAAWINTLIAAQNDKIEAAVADRVQSFLAPAGKKP